MSNKIFMIVGCSGAGKAHRLIHCCHQAWI
mgnify:CR=1 FL=1